MASTEENEEGAGEGVVEGSGPRARICRACWTGGVGRGRSRAGLCGGGHRHWAGRQTRLQTLPPCAAAVALPSDHPSHLAANGGSIPEALERVTSRRQPSPIRVSDAQADAFLRMREEQARAAEEVRPALGPAAALQDCGSCASLGARVAAGQGRGRGRKRF